MKTLAVISLLLGTLLPAQTTFVAPAGYNSKAGSGLAFNTAWDLAGPSVTAMRFQCTDDTLPVSKATLTGVEWRSTTTRSYTKGMGQGRQFSRTSLRLGNAVKRIGVQMSSNWAGTATTVFAGKWSLPTISIGLPKQKWGNAGSMTFTSGFMWDASKGHMLQEWTHSGGQLANGSSGSASYYVDGNTGTPTGRTMSGAAPESGTTADRYVPRHYRYFNACNDSGISTRSFAAYARLHVNVHADNTHSVIGGKAQLTAWTEYTAPGRPMLSMLSAGGSDQGIKAGLLCNNIHVNTAFPLLILATTASKDARKAFTRWDFPWGVADKNYGKLFDWDDSWAGQTVYWQAVWDDSRIKAPAATIATKLTLPRKPIYTLPKGSSWSCSEHSVKGVRYPPDTAFPSMATNPIERWSRK